MTEKLEDCTHLRFLGLNLKNSRTREEAFNTLITTKQVIISLREEKPVELFDKMDSLFREIWN